MTAGVSGLAEIVLWVRDMDAALAFYRDLLGLEVLSPPDFKNKFLKVSDGAHGVPEMIVLIPHPGPDQFPREKARRVLHHIAFRVDRSAYEELRARLAGAGLEVRGGIHPVLKAVNTFYVDDPDGNEVEFISPE